MLRVGLGITNPYSYTQGNNKKNTQPGFGSLADVTPQAALKIANTLHLPGEEIDDLVLAAKWIVKNGLNHFKDSAMYKTIDDKSAQFKNAMTELFKLHDK